jgi:hypothetical protein
VFAALGITALVTSSNAQQNELPIDFGSIFKTYVSNTDSVIGGIGTTASHVPLLRRSTSFGGNPYIVGSTITPTTTFPEAEEHIAVDPSNNANLIAAISDFSNDKSFNNTKYAFSTNNGSSWRERFVPTDPVSGLLVTGDGLLWSVNSDPVVANDRIGNVYLSELYFNVKGNANGLYVNVATRSPSGRVIFTASQTYAVEVNPSPTTNIFEDKPWIAVDNSKSKFQGNVYVSWAHFFGNSDTIFFSKSIDHGVTWSKPIQISRQNQNGAVQGSQVAVGRNGDVYVVYEVFYTNKLRRHFLAKSTDGGQTFTASVAITPYFNEATFKSTYRKNSFAALAVSPVNDFVYVVYSDKPGGGVGTEIEFIRSTAPGGTNFTPPVIINDESAGQQFFPAVAVDGSGVIHVSWFDTRNSPLDTSLYDIYATYSKDNGDTFSPNARVTANTVDAGTAKFIGDYMGIAAANGFAHPVWTSGGFNNGLLQTATLTLP